MAARLSPVPASKPSLRTCKKRPTTPVNRGRLHRKELGQRGAGKLDFRFQHLQKPDQLAQMMHPLGIAAGDDKSHAAAGNND